jgi:hypothetical protein
MRKSRGWFALAALALMIAGAPSLRAERKCSARDYRGTYAFYSNGLLLSLPPEAAALIGPIAQAGTFTSDGEGNIDSRLTVSWNGYILPGDTPIKYTITPDCVLSMSLTLPPPVNAPATFLGVLSHSERQMTLTISSPPGTLVVGDHAKQDVRFCGGSELQGDYQVDFRGLVVAPAERAGPFSRLGRLVADGHGHFSAKTLANYAGRAVEEDFDGTYSISGRCNLTLNYTFNGEDISINGALAGHGESFYMVVASPGWASAGTLRAQ